MPIPEVEPEVTGEADVGSEFGDRIASLGDAERFRAASELKAETKETEPVKEKEKVEGASFDLESHPAFKTLSEKAADAIRRAELAEARFETLQQTLGKSKGESEDKPDWVNYADEGEDKARADLEGNLLGFVGNIGRQLNAEIMKNVRALFEEQAGKTTKEQTVEKFLSDNKEFGDFWKGGQIHAEMKKNPLLNEVGAYYKLTAEKAIEKAAEKAKAEGEEQGRLQAEAKAGRRVLGVAPGRRPIDRAETPPELKNPEAFGGTTKALLRLLEQREAEGG